MKGGTIFETAWGMRGFENLVTDMMTNKDFAACLLDKITNFSISNASYFASCGADVLLTGDDFGMQDRMMISPKMWREWFKPRYAELISSVKVVNPEMLVFYHSDGMIEPIIPDLIEIGVDILNPVQPECMDPVKIKRTIWRSPGILGHDWHAIYNAVWRRGGGQGCGERANPDRWPGGWFAARANTQTRTGCALGKCARFL